MDKKPFTVQLDRKAISDFGEVATFNHSTPNAFGAMVLGKVSQLKPELALAALGSIPQEFFKRGKGRPTKTP